MNADAVQFKNLILGCIFPLPGYCIRCHRKRAPLFFHLCNLLRGRHLHIGKKR